MLLRIRWFLLGALSSLGTIAYLAVQVRRARERLSPSALARSGSRTVTTILDRTADRIAPSSSPPEIPEAPATWPQSTQPRSTRPRTSPPG